MSPQQSLTSGFSQWLEETTGGVTPLHAVSPGAPLTPFGTSMRVTKRVTGWLHAIDAGENLDGVRPEQKLIDLRANGLIVTAPATRVTPLGATVLARWEKLGVANDLDEHEIIRDSVLAREGVKAGIDRYVRHMQFWLQLRRLRSAVGWFSDAETLLLVSYLNKTDRFGYNPFLVLSGLGQQFPRYDDWRAWAGEMAVPSGWGVSRLQRVLDRIDLRYRHGLIAYCTGLETICLVADGVHGTEVRARVEEMLSV